MLAAEGGEVDAGDGAVASGQGRTGLQADGVEGGGGAAEGAEAGRGAVGRDRAAPGELLDQDHGEGRHPARRRAGGGPARWWSAASWRAATSVREAGRGPSRADPEHDAALAFRRRLSRTSQGEPPSRRPRTSVTSAPGAALRTAQWSSAGSRDGMVGDGTAPPGRDLRAGRRRPRPPRRRSFPQWSSRAWRLCSIWMPPSPGVRRLTMLQGSSPPNFSVGPGDTHLDAAPGRSPARWRPGSPPSGWAGAVPPMRISNRRRSRGRRRRG